MGEDHPAEPKVVVSFSPSHPALNLTPIQRAKLIKIAGARYNPSKDLITMSCETFDTGAQNKRYLGDLVEVLLKEARDPADTFEDIPFDFRHHRPKPEFVFPEEWKLTPERKEALLATRREQEAKRIESDAVPMDGLMYAPDGKRIRAVEMRKERALQDEEAKLADPETTQDDKVALEEFKKSRSENDRLKLVEDARARRPSKRGLLSPLLVKVEPKYDLSKRL
jgi:hypothetical protein